MVSWLSLYPDVIRPTGWLLPSGYHPPGAYQGYVHCRAGDSFPLGGLLRVSDGTEQTGHLTLAGEQTPSVSIADALR